MNLFDGWNVVSYLIGEWSLSGMSAAGVYIAGVVLCMVIPYLLGSLNFGLIISRRAYHDDVRTHGSGNAGTTNMLRTYGKKAALLTLVGDMLKAAVAVALGYLILDIHYPILDGTGVVTGVVYDHVGAAIAGLFVMLGHVFPCYFRFKGGKGVATAAVVVLMTDWLTFLICFVIFVVIVLGTKFVSLGSIMGIIIYPLILTAFSNGQNASACMAAVAMAVLVVWAHRENIKRLKDGKESKISFKSKKKQQEPAPAVVPDEPEKEYEFVNCAGCQRLIPRSRKVCAYCDTPNALYAPDPEEGDGKQKSKRKKK